MPLLKGNPGRRNKRPRFGKITELSTAGAKCPLASHPYCPFQLDRWCQTNVPPPPPLDIKSGSKMDSLPRFVRTTEQIYNKIHLCCKPFRVQHLRMQPVQPPGPETFEVKVQVQNKNMNRNSQPGLGFPLFLCKQSSGVRGLPASCFLLLLFSCSTFNFIWQMRQLFLWISIGQASN